MCLLLLKAFFDVMKEFTRKTVELIRQRRVHCGELRIGERVDHPTDPDRLQGMINAWAFLILL